VPGPAFGLSRTLFIYFVSSEEEVHPYLPYPPHTQPRLRCRQPWLNVQLKKSIRPVPWAHRHLLEASIGLMENYLAPRSMVLLPRSQGRLQWERRCD
jgi:hypothetical protein